MSCISPRCKAILMFMAFMHVHLRRDGAVEAMWNRFSKDQARLFVRHSIDHLTRLLENEESA